MDLLRQQKTINRLGLHYFPDTQHYRESDLLTWLPELKSLGVAWLTVIAPTTHAIPEPFLSGLLNARIEPILHFQLPIEPPIESDSLHPLFNSYASWGVRYAILFDKPNSRSQWLSSGWAQAELVERFLDVFLPLAEAAHHAGLIPVFPPLEPGGDYWDTAFLRIALQGLQRRSSNRILDSLILSAYGWCGDRPLSWGAGGPERFPGARPYMTPKDQEDQRGFYIFDWYLTIARAVFGVAKPLILLEAGKEHGFEPRSESRRIDDTHLTKRTLPLIRLITSTGDKDNPDIPDSSAEQPNQDLEPVSPEVISTNFWLLSASAESSYARQAWFRPDGSISPIVHAVRQWRRIKPFSAASAAKAAHAAPPTHPIAHYLLLPPDDGSALDWQQETIRPFVQKYHPTIGFSLVEAALAEHVIVLAGEQEISDHDIDRLRTAGCFVERIPRDGTSIASHLISR